MRHFIITFILLHSIANLSAQSIWSTTNEEQYNSEIRQKLNLDYSMPDYQLRKIDSNVMGPRLATILQDLCVKYKQDNYLSILSMIQCDHIEGLDYCKIEKMGLENVSKKGNTISICFKTTLTKNPLDLKKFDLLFTFVDGVSGSRRVNSLFANICNYIR